MSFALLAAVASLVLTTAPHVFPRSLPIVDNVARLDMGCKQMQTKHFADAAATFTDLLDVSPNDAMALFRRGQCYYCMQKYSEAIKDFNAAIESDQEISAFYLWRGTANAKLSNDDQAISDYQRAMELDPSLTLVVRQAAAKTAKVDSAEPVGDGAKSLSNSSDGTDGNTPGATDAPVSETDDKSGESLKGANRETDMSKEPVTKAEKPSGIKANLAPEVRGIVAKETARIEGDSRNGADQMSPTTIDLGYNERAVIDYREALRRTLEKKK
jgi:tetratricopeptide (TPR) repeat protein